MKPNDWIALNLNIQGSGLTPDDLRGYNITPDNTGLENKDYYKNIPQVQEAFKAGDGTFDEDAFSQFYRSAQRSYSRFAEDDYIKNIVDSIPTSSTDIFSLGNTNIYDDSVQIVRSKDPERHQLGIGNIFSIGPASFSEREVAQANWALDENGNELDWKPNDKGGIFKGLFRPAMALAVWESDGVDENGISHKKGERRYDIWGDPMYQELGNKTVYGRDVLHYADTITKEGSWWNTIDPFDSDSVKKSAGRVLYSTLVRALPYLTPAAEIFGAIEATRAIMTTLPVITKMINGIVTGNNENEVGQLATTIENYMSRFDWSLSDEAKKKGFWSVESIGNQLVESATQLYSQGLIQKIPYILHKNPTLLQRNIGQALATTYLATTSANDVYEQYLESGVNEATAGIAALATMGAFAAFMSNDYFKQYLFNDPALESPELKRTLRNLIKAVKKTVSERAGITPGAQTTEAAAKWYNKVWRGTINALKWSKEEIFSIDNPYIVRGFNEGVEEVMEEGATDLIKGLTLGAERLGWNVRKDENEEIDFGFSPEDFLSRYSTAFVGGALGGIVFEGLQQYNNRVLHRGRRYTSDLNDDERLMWFIRNGRTKELLDIIDNWEKRGKIGSKNISWEYEIETNESGKEEIVWKPGTENANQNTQIANNLRTRIRTLAIELQALNFMQTDNEILQKAMSTIKQEAKKAGMSVEEYQEAKLRDARIDFIKARNVDRLIMLDVADIQDQMIKLNRQIKDRTATIMNVQDTEKAEAQKRVEKDEYLKELNKELTEARKNLDDLLGGKRANEYLSIALFASDDNLVDMYLSQKKEDKTGSYFISTLENFVRAKYGQNLEEMLKRADETGGRKDLEEHLMSDFEAWRKAVNNDQDPVVKIRGAYNIHKNLSNLISPVIKSQIDTYSQYKMDTNRIGIIRALQADEAYIEEFQNKFATLENELIEKLDDNPLLEGDLYIDDSTDDSTIIANRILNAHSGIDSEFDEKVKQYKKLRYKGEILMNPAAQLDVLLTGDSPDQLLNLLSEDGDAFAFLKKYYKELNDNKLVSEFSEDLLEHTALIEATKYLPDAGNYLTNFYLRTVASVYSAEPNFVLLLEQLADDETLGFYIELDGQNVPLNLAFAQLLDAYISQTVPGKFEFYGKTDHIYNHFGRIIDALDDFENRDEILQQIEDLGNEIGIDVSEDGLADLIMRVDGASATNDVILNEGKYASFVNIMLHVLSEFKKSTRHGIAAYDAAVAYIQSLINEHETTITDAKAFVDEALFGNKANLVDEINQIKTIRQSAIHSPIIDIVNALSTTFNGETVPLWKLLQDEINGLADLSTIEDYVINNPSAASELKFLNNVLNSVAAIIRGAITNKDAGIGVNSFINMTGETELPVIDNLELAGIYNQDLLVIQQRISTLLTLNERNKKSTVKLRKEAMAVNVPKFIKKIIQSTEDKAEDDIGFRRAFWDKCNVDIVDLWGNAFDLDSVTVDNVDQLWTAVRDFMNKMYNVIKEKDIHTQDLADLITSGFTDLWKMETFTIDNNPETEITNFGVVQFLTMVLGEDPNITFGTMKTVGNSPSLQVPFWDQMLAIGSGFVHNRNSKLYDAVLDKINKQTISVLNDNSNTELQSLSEEDRTYLKDRLLVSKAIFIDGSSGTGKSSVVLPYIKQMLELVETKDDDGNVIPRRTIATAKYQTRKDALANTLKVSGDDAVTLNELFEQLLGEKITGTFSDRRGGHACVLNQEIKDKLRKRANDSNLWKPNEIVDIYIDESGLLSEAEIEFLKEAASYGEGVNLIFVGDIMQNGATVTYRDSDGKAAVANSGQMDILAITTPRLNLSMRAGNWGMVHTLTGIEQNIQLMLDVWRKKPWINAKDLKTQVDTRLLKSPFKFFESETGISGFNITNDPEAAFNKLKSLIKGDEKICIITDHADDYSSKISSNVHVFTKEQVQGGEYAYVLIDVRSLNEDDLLDYYRSVYTMVSRAQNGGFIVNGLGSKFDSAKSDVLATTLVKPDEDGGDNELSEYKDWWRKKLMKPDTWDSPESSSGSTPSGGTPTSTTSSGGSTTSSSGSTTSSGSSSGSGTSSNSSTSGGGVIPGTMHAGEIPPVTDGDTRIEATIPSFNEDAWKNDIKTNGSKSGFVNSEAMSKQKREDFDNYSTYHNTIEDSTRNDLVDFKSFIDWLFGDESKAFFDSKWNPLKDARLTPEQILQFKEFIRNFALDYFQLDDETLSEKYKEDGKLFEEWANEFSGSKKFRPFLEALFKRVVEDCNKKQRIIYSVVDGDYAYFYYIVGTGTDYYAIPIARVRGYIDNGHLSIIPKQETPLILLSSNGNGRYDIKKVAGHYADVSDEAHILVTRTEDINIAADEVGDELRHFMWHAKGIAHVTVSSTFMDNDSNLFDKTTNSQGAVIRMDKTGESHGRKRLSALGRKVPFQSYYHYACLLNKIKSDPSSISNEDMQELRNFFGDSVITGITNGSNSRERTKALGKAYLLSNGTREKLISALLRFWSQSEDNVNKQKFIANFCRYASQDKWIKKATNDTDPDTYGQHGITLTINNRALNGYIISSTLYVALDVDQQAYNIYIRDHKGYFQLACSIPTDSINFTDSKIFNPADIAKNIISALPKSTVYNSTIKEFINTFGNALNSNTENYDDLIKTGTISIGLGTVYTSEYDGNAKYVCYPCFDTTIATLFEGIDNVSFGTIDKFLESDPMFKYGLIIGFKGETSALNIKEDWLKFSWQAYGEQGNQRFPASTDIMEIIPPLYSISGSMLSGTDLNVYPSDLGSLYHLGMTENPTDISTTKSTVDGKTTWTFDRGLNMSLSDLKGKYGMIVESDDEATLSGVTALKIKSYSQENGKNYIHTDTQRFEVSDNFFNEIIQQMTHKEVPQIFIKNQKNIITVTTINDDSKYKLTVDGREIPVTILSYYNKQLYLLDGNGNVYIFNNVPQDKFNKLSSKWAKTQVTDTNEELPENIEVLAIDQGNVLLKDDTDIYYIVDGQTVVKNPEITISDDAITYNGTPLKGVTNIINALKRDRGNGSKKSESAQNDLRDTLRNQAERTWGKTHKDLIDIAFDKDVFNSIESAEAFALEHAEELGGIYKWNKDRKNWIQPKDDQRHYYYALWVKQNNPDASFKDLVKVNIEVSENRARRNEETWTVNGETFNVTWDRGVPNIVKINSVSTIQNVIRNDFGRYNLTDEEFNWIEDYIKYKVTHKNSLVKGSIKAFRDKHPDVFNIIKDSKYTDKFIDNCKIN